MEVVKFTAHASRETRELAQWLLEYAEHIAGTGITIRMLDGDQHTVFTGLYKRLPDSAAGVALRLSVKLAAAANDTFG